MVRIRSIGVAAFIVLTSVLPGQVHAVCDASFDNAPAKGFTASMVRAFRACPTEDTPPNGNTEAEGDIPACAPVTPPEIDGDTTEYRYSRDGSCQVKVTARLADDCAEIEGSNGELLGLPSGPCHVSRVQMKCKGILDGVNILIDDEHSGWTLSATLRASFDDGASAMTVIDLPVSFDFETPEAGGMKLDALTAEPLQELGVVLPACTVLQFVRMEIRDPLGRPFARMGWATIPSTP